MKISLYLLFLIVASSSLFFVLFVQAAGDEQQQKPTTLKGNWVIAYNPAVQSIREHLLTDMSGGEGGTIRIHARFISTDGTLPGVFNYEVKKLIPSTCRSSPNPEFWDKFGDRLFSPESVHLEGNAIAFTLRKVPASIASFYLPGGKTQTITCGPIVKADGTAPTSKGFFLEPATFGFQIVASAPSLVFLRHPDHFPYASVTYRSQQKNARRADFDHIELYANPRLGFGGIDFYIGAIGNEFEISNPYNEQDSDANRLAENSAKDSEADRSVKLEFKKEIARKFFCSPAPCHIRLRNRTHNFRDFDEAQSFARANNFTDPNNKNNNINTAAAIVDTASWLDGSSGEDSQIFRAEDISIIHAGLVRLTVSPTALFDRGFDLLPLDDVEKTKTLPKKASVYKLQLRNIDNKFLKVPLEDKPLERLMYLTMEAPYAPAQNLRITYVDERMSAYPLIQKSQGPLIVTDRCIASGFQFHVDEEVRKSVMPSHFVHRCPMSLIIHGDMLPALHPLGATIDSLFVPGRCIGQKIDCKGALFKEVPPGVNAYLKKRLAEDVKGFFSAKVDAASSSSSSSSRSTVDLESGLTGEAADQQLMFPKEIRENLVTGDQNAQQSTASSSSSSSSSEGIPFYPLATEEILGLNNRSSINPDEWIQDFDFFSKGALRVKVRPLPDFRVKQATFLSLAIHPSIIRNGRPSDATQNPMGILVVPSHGIVKIDIVVAHSSSSSTSTEYHLTTDERDAGVVAVIPVNSDTNEVTINVIWKMDEYEEFSSVLLQQLHEKFSSGENLVTSSSSSSSSSFVFPSTWSLFAGPDSGNENTVCAEWMTQPASATSVVVNAAPTDKEIRLQLTFNVPSASGSSTTCNKIELSAPGFVKEQWSESGRMPLVKSTKIKLINPV